jgi:hypothetical protein
MENIPFDIFCMIGRFMYIDDAFSLALASKYMMTLFQHEKFKAAHPLIINDATKEIDIIFNNCPLWKKIYHISISVSLSHRLSNRLRLIPPSEQYYTIGLLSMDKIEKMVVDLSIDYPVDALAHERPIFIPNDLVSLCIHDASIEGRHLFNFIYQWISNMADETMKDMINRLSRVKIEAKLASFAHFNVPTNFISRKLLTKGFDNTKIATEVTYASDQHLYLSINKCSDEDLKKYESICPDSEDRTTWLLRPT